MWSLDNVFIVDPEKLVAAGEQPGLPVNLSGEYHFSSILVDLDFGDWFPDLSDGFGRLAFDPIPLCRLEMPYHFPWDGWWSGVPPASPVMICVFSRSSHTGTA